jgi:hypothetical protein
MDTLIEQYRRRLIGLNLAHVWRGYGSAIFLEFGELRERKFKNGKPRNPGGEFGVMIQWTWRIERDDCILCGSSNDDVIWEPIFFGLKDATAIELQLFGRLPEIDHSFKWA